jgi:two-component system sensor kinase FixL
VVVDPIQVEQVLLNLLKNALDAVAECSLSQREIIISTTGENRDEVLVRVTNRGGPVPRDVLDKAFHPFFTTKPDGLGLGLSISRSIIEAHGGRLWAISTKESGTVFSFTLPAKPTYLNEDESVRDIPSPF